MPLLAIVLPNVIQGHCTRGDRCWFRHVLPKVAPDDDRIQFNAETCCICLEKPTTYGLLSKSPSRVTTGGVVLNDAQRTAATYSVSTSALRFVPPFSDTHRPRSVSVSGVLLRANHPMSSRQARSSVVPYVVHHLVLSHRLHTSFRMVALAKRTRLVHIKPAWRECLASKSMILLLPLS